MTAGRAALLGLMDRYLAGLMDPSVSLLEIHKLMYFMQERGESLRLNYVKGHYGPYAENLRYVLSKLEGHYIQGFGEGEEQPEKEIELKPGAAVAAQSFLDNLPDTRGRFELVADLVNGFETPFGTELLATVHWLATRENVQSPMEATRKTHEWNERKAMFDSSQIQLAWETLKAKGWLPDLDSTHAG